MSGGWVDCSRRDALRMAGLGAAAAMAAALGACTRGSRSGGATPSVPSSGTPATLDVRTFGAVGDGTTDDTDAIARALRALKSGQTLHFPEGRTFCHRSVLSVQIANVTLTGPGTLKATQEESSAVKIEADDVTVDRLTMTTPRTTRRWSSPDQHKLYIGPFTGSVVRDVTIDGSAAAGVFCDGVSRFRLKRLHVSNTRADGIHMTRGSHDGTVTSPVVSATGDDGVAVVSYLDDGDPCHDITVTSPTVRSTTGGRGLSVVGGKRVTHTDIDVSATSAAGVYIACESGDFITASTSDIRVQGGQITGANTDAAIDHGAVLVYGGRSDGDVSDVTVSALKITKTRSTAPRQIGVVADSGNDIVSGITFEDLVLDASPQPYQGDAPAGAVTLHNVVAAGSRVRPPS